ncbi:hypothetical protein I4U23_022906 [Adineta vaga]|nr:hypothetical protein I4U23_022906 [Adineta vaga]
MQLLVEILSNMDCSKSPVDELNLMCREFIKRDNKDWGNAFVFLGVYDSFNPIKWYTKEPFIYRFLNEILRNGDIDKLIILRMLVRDINNQLELEHRKFVEPRVTVYRGQAMKLTELKYLQKHIGHTISMNSFLSTSRDRDMALIYTESIDKTDPSLTSVLFVIDCDTRRVDTKPFADISHLSCFGGEKEILFMLGSVFRVDEIHKNQTNDLWTIEMTLCGKDDYDFENLFQSRRYDADKAPTLTSLGLLFQKMGDFKRAAQCFQQHLNLSEDENPSIRAASYHSLGNIAKEHGDNDKTLDYFNESMTIRLNSPSVKKIHMGSLHNDVGNVYSAKKDHARALEYYKEALRYTLESVEENRNQSAMIYCNIGDVYRNLNQYELALSNLEEFLQILTNLGQENQPDCAKTLITSLTSHKTKVPSYKQFIVSVSSQLNLHHRIKDLFLFYIQHNKNG